MTKRKRCATCQYWQGRGNMDVAALGDCHGVPPTPLVIGRTGNNVHVKHVRSQTKAGELCGFWVPMENQGDG